MKTSKLLLASLLAAGTTFSTTSLAADDRTTVDIELGQYYFDFEDTGGTFTALGAPYGKAPGEADDSGGAVTLGFAAGEDWSVKLRLYGASGEDHENTPSPSGCLGMKPVDGSSAVSDGSCAGNLLMGFKTEIDYQGLDVMAGKPVYSSDLQTLSLYGSVSLARLTQEHSFYGSPDVGISLGDELDTTYFGVGVGLDHVLNLTERLTLTGTLRADALQAKTDLDAVQNLFGVHTVSDSDRDVIGRAIARVGLAWDFGAVSVGLNAFAEYLSDVATVEHSVIEGIVQPSRIGSEDGTVYGYNLTVGVAF